MNVLHWLPIFVSSGTDGPFPGGDREGLDRDGTRFDSSQSVLPETRRPNTAPVPTNETAGVPVPTLERTTLPTQEGENRVPPVLVIPWKLSEGS